MKYEKQKEIIKSKFPFPGYIDNAVDSYETIADTVQKYLSPGSHILDFGSGPCDKLSMVQLLGFNCYACDDLMDDWHKIGENRKKIIQFSKEIGIDFRLMTDNQIPFKKESFDMVMMHDVIEHLHNSPRGLLNSLIELIKPNGYLFITVPNLVFIRKRLSVLLGRTNLPGFEVFFWYPGEWRGHIREYVKNDLVGLSRNTGLSIEELRDCHIMIKKRVEKLPKAYRWLYLLIHGLLPGWRDSWLLVAKKPTDWVAKTQLTQDEVAKMLGPVSPFYNAGCKS